MVRTTGVETIHTDIAIVGGGVAGSSLAAALARDGLDVVVVEREARFRDRVRGEGVHPWGVKEADRLGLLPVLRAAGANELMRWQIYRERQPVYAFRWDDEQPGTPGEWAIYHPTLQDALIAHAAASGARVLRPARVTHFEPGDRPGIDVTSDDGDVRITARLVVGADGRQSAARRWVGAETVHDPVHHQIGGCLLDGVALDEGSSHYAGFEGGFAMAFPQGGGRARTYLICDSAIAERLRGHGARQVRAFIESCAAALPAGALDAAQPAGPMAFFPNADIWAERAAGNGVALIGDAAGANDPSLGQGLSICFKDARELRDQLLATDDWQAAAAAYAARHAEYYAVLRAFGQWRGLLTTETGPEADARRARYEAAQQIDPTQGGFGAMFSNGPEGLVADEAARRHFFGEDLELDE